MASAAHFLVRDPQATVLALYPQKALIQDQYSKWQSILEPLGLNLAYIHGKVKEDRANILSSARVVLMTPDVAHAWLLSHLHVRKVRQFLNNLQLLVLDEAHVYDGAFGSNMAYLLRRLQNAAREHRMICSTATLGRPEDFVFQLTGKTTVPVLPEEDASPNPSKSIILAQPTGQNSFDAIVQLIKQTTIAHSKPFLAFCDSRKMVEQIVAASQRTSKDDDDCEGESEAVRKPTVLPYRAGYEEHDRQEIQKALAESDLSGVVCTSAMELGIDIGDIEVILLCTVPPALKSFWQRFGRVGRRAEGVCLVVDSKGILGDSADALTQYLSKELEPSWLYLDNRYIQYTNALCTAKELQVLNKSVQGNALFDSVPESFREFVANELNPTETLPQDLYVLKLEAADSPHYQFPIRSASDRTFKVRTTQLNLGELTWQQALREAYPGAIYYYMGRPYRVYLSKRRVNEIWVRREKHWTTRPIQVNRAFPNFSQGLLNARKSTEGFIAETQLQVTETVLGFVEKRGSAADKKHYYRADSEYSQSTHTRNFETTGVCWSFPSSAIQNEKIASVILEAFCIRFGIHERDLGIAPFTAKQSPFGSCSGMCIYDSTNGSLRLTQRLTEQFGAVIDDAINICSRQYSTESDQQEIMDGLRALQRLASDLTQIDITSAHRSSPDVDTHWITVIAKGEQAFYQASEDVFEIQIDKQTYTPSGLVYTFKHPTPDTVCSAPESSVKPLYGTSKLVRLNLITGEEESIA